MAIETLAYKLVMDHKDFTEGAVASRRELSAAKQLMATTKTPAEQLAAAQESLAALHRKGAIDAKTYARAQKQIKDSYKEQAVEAEVLETKSEKLMKRLGAFAAAGGPLVALTAGFALAAKAGRALGNVFVKQNEQIVTIADTADKLGLTTQQFVAMDFAAGQAGITTEAMGTAIQRMVRKVGDANRGMREAAQAFEKIGLNARDLKDLDPATVFLKVQQAIANQPDHFERLSATVKIFDSEGAALVRTLGTLTEEAFPELLEQVEDLGIAFGPETAAKMREFQVAVDELDKRFTGFARGGAAEMSGVATQLVRDVDALTASLSKADEASGGLFSQFALETVEKATAGIGGGLAIKLARDYKERADRNLAEAIKDDVAQGSDAIVDEWENTVEEMAKVSRDPFEDMFSTIPVAEVDMLEGIFEKMERDAQKTGDATDKLRQKMEQPLSANTGILKGSAEALALQEQLAQRGSSPSQQAQAVSADATAKATSAEAISIFRRIESNTRVQFTVEESTL